MWKAKDSGLIQAELKEGQCRIGHGVKFRIPGENGAFTLKVQKCCVIN